jgi:hypothetical protein
VTAVTFTVAYVCRPGRWVCSFCRLKLCIHNLGQISGPGYMAITASFATLFHLVVQVNDGHLTMRTFSTTHCFRHAVSYSARVTTAVQKKKCLFCAVKRTCHCPRDGRSKEKVCNLMRIVKYNIVHRSSPLVVAIALCSPCIGLYPFSKVGMLLYIAIYTRAQTFSTAT